MSIGLIAFLVDAAGLAKVAAASIDDVAAQVARAGTKATGVAIHDAAVTSGYVVGFSPVCELPIIGRIALGSLRARSPARRTGARPVRALGGGPNAATLGCASAMAAGPPDASWERSGAP